jgi:phage head maturation protease
VSTLVAFGGAAKALGAGKFRAPLVTFSGPDSPDLTGDFFNAETDFWTLKDGRGEVVLLYGHGQDPTLKHAKLGSGKASVEMDDAGIWMEGQLNLADEYEKAIYGMIEAGKMGTSSGAVAHLVTRESKGDACWIKSWPLFEGSLTPTPAEPRNKVASVKSLKGMLVAEWGSPEGEGEFEGIGSALLNDGLTAIFRRVCWSLYEAINGGDSDPAAAAAAMDQVLDKANALMKRYSRSVITSFAGSEDEEAAAVAETLKVLGGGRANPSSLKEIERLLRDACGFSRKDATAIASHGFAGLQRDAVAPAPSLDDELKGLLAETLTLSSKTLALTTAGLENNHGS